MNRHLRPMHLILLSLLMVGLGVSPCLSLAQASAQTSAKKKAKSSNTSHKGKATKSSRRQVGQKAPTPQRISEIQQALAKNGAFAGTPNGKWDTSTVEAMKKFQGAHALNPSGKLDAKTLQQLGLGSQTAGIAAPTPAIRISSGNNPQGSLQGEPQSDTLSSRYKAASKQ
jgi:peptidoglycan hydrolase-like protein with peptidoglycan-binding domain